MTKDTSTLGKVIEIDEARIKDHLGELVRDSVEDTLNTLLEAEADQMCNAARYERTEARRDTRAGTYERKLQTKTGECSWRYFNLRAFIPELLSLFCSVVSLNIPVI